MCRQSHKKHGSRQRAEQSSSDGRKKSSGKWKMWLIALAATFCYGNSLFCGLVFDDKPAIVDNIDVRPSTPVINLLYNDFWGTPMLREGSHKSFRPLCTLSFRINFWLHGLNPLGYHFVNVVLHSTVCLLYFKLCGFFLPSTPSFVASMLFAVHPIHTEAVTGVVGRAELLSSILFLSALWTYIKSINHQVSLDYKSLVQCLILTSLSMFCKEQGVTAVAVCITYDILLVQQKFHPPAVTERSPRGKVKGPTPTWRKDLVLRLLAMFTGTVFILIIRIKAMGSKLPVFSKFDNPAASSEWPTRYLTYNYLVALNSWLLLFPNNLCCDWTMGTVSLVTSLLDIRLLSIVCTYFVLCVLAWKSYFTEYKFSKSTLMGLSLCIFSFLPASNMFYPVGFVVAERVLYIPSMGFCLIVSRGWYILLRNANKKLKALLWICLILLLCLNAAKCIRRNKDWVSEETLFRSDIQHTGRNAKLYNNLGHVLESSGRHQEALELFLQAAKIQPDDLGSHLNLGQMYNTLGMLEKAEEAFWNAKNLLPKARPGESYHTHIVPRHLDLFLNLGSLLSKNDSRLVEAEELYKEAITMKTDYIDAYVERANILLKLNRSDEAHDMYREALKYDQMNPDIFYNLGVLFLEQGDPDQALAQFDQALHLDPGHEKSLLNYAIITQESPDSNLRKLAHERLQLLLSKGQHQERSHFNLGVMAMKDGNIRLAERHFLKAIQLRPKFEGAIFNLGLLLHDTGRPLEAVPFLKQLENSTHVKALFLLGNIYFDLMKDFRLAQKCYERILQIEPNNIPALHNFCAAYFELRKLKEAEFCFQKASFLAPQETSVQKHLSLVREHRKQAAKFHNKLKNCSRSNCDINIDVNKMDVPKRNDVRRYL